MTSIDKQDIHWPDYSRGSKFGKIIAYGIGAKLTIIAEFLFNMWLIKKKEMLNTPSSIDYLNTSIGIDLISFPTKCF